MNAVIEFTSEKIILKLSEYDELNQSKLMRYCRLNNVEHKAIIDEMTVKNMIMRFEEPWGIKIIIKDMDSEKTGRFFTRYQNHMKCYSQGREQKLITAGNKVTISNIEQGREIR
jgi:hypothetical protein